MLNVLTFFLNEELFAIPVSDLLEVNRMAKCRPVEKATHWVHGVINFHGETTPVLNLKKLLSIETSELNQKAMWLAVHNNGSLLCLAVDKVGEFLHLTYQVIDEMPNLVDGTDVEYIKYYARISDKLIPVLDIGGIVALSRKGTGNVENAMNDISETTTQ